MPPKGIRNLKTSSNENKQSEYIAPTAEENNCFDKNTINTLRIGANTDVLHGNAEIYTSSKIKHH